MADEMSKTKSGTGESGMTDMKELIQLLVLEGKKRDQERQEGKERYEQEKERNERERERYERERKEERRQAMERFEWMQEERNRERLDRERRQAVRDQERREERERYERDRKERRERFERMQEEQNRERRERMERFERMHEERNRDFYTFCDLLKLDDKDGQMATRAQTKRETDQRAKEDREQRNCGVKSTNLEESTKDITTEFGDLDTEFFQVTTPKSKVNKTRSQKREDRKAYQKKDREMDTKIQDTASENLNDLQTKDLSENCRTSEICQKTSKHATKMKAPMQSLPIIEEPFSRIAMDIVRPLEQSKADNKEVPQKSTGYSPFELLYGWKVRGPLDIMKEIWSGTVTGPRSVVLHVESMRDRLATMVDFVKNNMEKFKQRQMKGNNKRLTRWNSNLQPFCYEVIYRKGLSNGHANGLTRTGQG